MKQIIAISVLASSLLACSRESARTSTVERDPASTTAVAALDALGYFSAGQQNILVYTTAGQAQYYRLIDFQTFTLIDQENHVLFGEPTWIKAAQSYPTRLAVANITSAGYDHFLAAGHKRSGELVLQLWTTPEIPGSIAVTPAAPGVQHTLKPKELLQTPLIEFPDKDIVDLVYDKDHRYIVAVLRDKNSGQVSVVQYFLNGTQIVSQSTLATSSQYPELEFAEFANQMAHVDLGQVLDLECPAVSAISHRILFCDQDQNGTFDGPPISATTLDLITSGVDVYEKWSNYLSE